MNTIAIPLFRSVNLLFVINACKISDVYLFSLLSFPRSISILFSQVRMMLAFIFFNRFFRCVGFLFVIKACNISDI